MTKRRSVSLRGGMDLITPVIEKNPGSVIACNNYEPHPRGYRRIGGFERYDGQSKPSAATYSTLDFDAGTAAINEDDTVTGATSGATGVAVADAVVESGSYVGTDAAGYIALTNISGTFQNNENLQVSAVTKCVADGTPVLSGADTDALDDTYQQAAIEYYRDQIAAVTGSGDILGIWTYNGDVYAFRDNAGGTACVMYKATSSGWSAVTATSMLDFSEGGIWVIEFDQTIADADFNKVDSANITPYVGDSVHQADYQNTKKGASGVEETEVRTIRWSGTILQIEIDSGGWATDNAVGRMVIEADYTRDIRGEGIPENGYDLNFPGKMLDATSTYPMQGFMIAGTTKVTHVKIKAGDIVKGVTSGAYGTVDRIVVDNGDFENGNAEGRVILTGISGTFSNSEGIITGDEFQYFDNRYAATVDGTTLNSSSFSAGEKFQFANYRFQNVTENLAEAQEVETDTGALTAVDEQVSFVGNASGISRQTGSTMAEEENQIWIDDDGSSNEDDEDYTLGQIHGKILLVFMLTATQGERDDPVANAPEGFDAWPQIHFKDATDSDVHGLRIIPYEDGGNNKIKVTSMGTDILTPTDTYTLASAGDDIFILCALDIDTGEMWITASDDQNFKTLSAPDQAYFGGGNPITGSDPCVILNRDYMNELRIWTVYPAIGPPPGSGTILTDPSQSISIFNDNFSYTVDDALVTAGFRLPGGPLVS